MVAGSSHLYPGEKGKIIARTSTAMKKDLLQETIEVVSNDPLSPITKLSVQATVVQ